MNIRGQNSKIHLWDTAGDEKFIFLISQYYRNVMHLSLCMILYKVKPFYLFQLDSKNQKKKSKRM
ncbi:unnamed protein product [Paramecium sonneborni]|uniref:Uncharacterized protein n=1 Tax=Paramecium sonneborni TaxID=65129 RepID=A0A8S1PED9_9CILI|nr:unnamed protein product [Paramecium sonneborni]